jgi:hypothetical protein
MRKAANRYSAFVINPNQSIYSKDLGFRDGTSYVLKLSFKKALFGIFVVI